MDSRAQRSAEGEAATPDNPHGWPVRNVAMPLCDPAGHCIARRPGSLFPMNNECQFSPCWKYRYTLEHVMEPLLPTRRIMWIGLNPSTADEANLDPTLRRIRAFSLAWGFTSFVMTNLFAFRATQPSEMLRQQDPVGPENDMYLFGVAQRCETVVACWGTIGRRNQRDEAVLALLGAERKVFCLGTNGGLTPKHPLYVAADTPLRPYN